MPRLNIDERNQAIGMLNAGMPAIGVLRMYSKDDISSVYGDDCVSQETLPTALDVVGHV